MRTVSIFVCCLLCGQIAGQEALAQPYAEPASSASLSAFDRSALYKVYRQDSRFAHAFYRTVDASSWPVFLGSPVVAWAGAWWIGDGTHWDEAYRLTVSNLATVIGVQILKKRITRYRPYIVLDDIVSRSHHHGSIPGNVDRESFPSGHSAQAFSIATSISLSYPRWYVIGPAAIWATGVALSRPWLGVHFPTDILAGAVIGAGMAILVHILDPYITPNSFYEELADRNRNAPVFRFNLTL